MDQENPFLDNDNKFDEKYQSIFDNLTELYNTLW